VAAEDDEKYARDEERRGSDARHAEWCRESERRRPRRYVGLVMVTFSFFLLFLLDRIKVCYSFGSY